MRQGRSASHGAGAAAAAAASEDGTAAKEGAHRERRDLLRRGREAEQHGGLRACAVEDLERRRHHLGLGAVGADALGEVDVREPVVEAADVAARVVAARAELALDAAEEL